MSHANLAQQGPRSQSYTPGTGNNHEALTPPARCLLLCTVPYPAFFIPPNHLASTEQGLQRLRCSRKVISVLCTPPSLSPDDRAAEGRACSRIGLLPLLPSVHVLAVGHPLWMYSSWINSFLVVKSTSISLLIKVFWCFVSDLGNNFRPAVEISCFFFCCLYWV